MTSDYDSDVEWDRVSESEDDDIPDGRRLQKVIQINNFSDAIIIFIDFQLFDTFTVRKG